jgi:hypothetical protein
MLHGISSLLTSIFDVLVLPFGDNRTAGLWGLSLVTGVALIFLFKVTSNQARIKATRDAFKARILEMRIYQDDIVLILKALGAALWTNVSYLRASLRPILVLLVVALPVFIQLDERYGRAPMEPGDTALLEVTLKDGVDPVSVAVTADGGHAVSLDTDPVRVPSTREISWRLRVNDAGVHPFTVRVYDTPYEFPVTAAVSNKPIGHTREANSLASPLLHPSLPMIPKNSAIESVDLHYPTQDYWLVFWQAPWWVVFLVLISVGALVPKFLFRIEI